MFEIALDRQAIAERGKRLEYFTVAWNSLEGLVALVAGAFAGSISLVGFGIDRFIVPADDLKALLDDPRLQTVRCRSHAMD